TSTRPTSRGWSRCSTPSRTPCPSQPPATTTGTRPKSCGWLPRPNSAPDRSPVAKAELRPTGALPHIMADDRPRHHQKVFQMLRALPLALASLTLAGCTPGEPAGKDAAAATVQATDALCRPTPAGRQMTGCYLTLTATADD